MDLNILVSSINEVTEIDQKLELINDLNNDIIDNRSVIINDIQKIYSLVKKNLIKSNYPPELTIAFLDLIDSLIKYSYSDLDVNFPLILPAMTKKLGEINEEIRNKILKLLLLYVEKTRNLTLILNCLSRVGFEDKNFFVRENCIKIIPKLLKYDPAIFFTKTGINEVRRIIENLIVSLSDKHITVRNQAIETLIIIKLIKFENFSKIFEQLCIQHQNIYMKLIQENEKKIKYGKMLEFFDNFEESFYDNAVTLTFLLFL